METKKNINIFFSTMLQTLIILTILMVIFTTWFHFYKTKHFQFIVEAPCDINTDTCYIRSCTDEGNYCPPNSLQSYRVFQINASDFDTCTENSCLTECLSGSIACTELLCEEDNVTSCSKQ
ncbi:MAG: hypothetical protein KBB88_00550 [Candidatus Pacebacteria bacterium]|nr:hypothetical protein [Candidatus Paceibacterota bacterium]